MHNCIILQYILDINYVMPLSCYGKINRPRSNKVFLSIPVNGNSSSALLTNWAILFSDISVTISQTTHLCKIIYEY